MLDYLLDKKGNLEAVLDFWIVDDTGKLDDKGDFIWINQLVVSKTASYKKVVAKLIKSVTDCIPHARFGYYKRSKYGDRLKIFKKSAWLRRANKGD
jgi:hypothetical protein